MKCIISDKRKIIHVGKYIPKLMSKRFGSDLLIRTQEQSLTVCADNSVFSSGQEMKYQIIKYVHISKYFPCVFFSFKDCLQVAYSSLILPSLCIWCLSEWIAQISSCCLNTDPRDPPWLVFFPISLPRKIHAQPLYVLTDNVFLQSFWMQSQSCLKE